MRNDAKAHPLRIVCGVPVGLAVVPGEPAHMLQNMALVIVQYSRSEHGLGCLNFKGKERE
jgi:hypothetical protein